MAHESTVEHGPVDAVEVGKSWPGAGTPMTVGSCAH